MIIDTIKLIASELGDMSPKTQLEIVKLCKNLCLAVKDYLVENDDKMSDIEDTIETLEGNITTLSNSISTIESELITAESNINANANAILTINDAIENIQSAITTIQNTLNNVYTKSEVNTLLNDIYTKSEVNTLLDLYYTKIQINELLNGKLDASDIKYVVVENRYTPVSFNDFQGLVNAKIGIIVYNGVRYYKQKVTFDSINDTTLIDLSSFDVQNGVCKVLALSSTNYLISPFDSYVAQEVLISGENIKTINGQSLLGSGDLPVGASLYKHCITWFNGSSSGDMFTSEIINNSNTPFTKETLAQWLYDKGFTTTRTNGSQIIQYDKDKLYPINNSRKVTGSSSDKSIFFTNHIYMYAYYDNNTPYIWGIYDSGSITIDNNFDITNVTVGNVGLGNIFVASNLQLNMNSFNDKVIQIS